MPTLIYSGSIATTTGLNNSPAVQLTGVGSASGVLNSVVATLNFSTNAYGTLYNVTAMLKFTGGSVSSTRSVKMDSSNYTNGQFDFTFDGLTLEQANAITEVSVSCSNNADKIYLKGTQSVTVEYLPVSKMGAPTKVELSATSAAPGASVTLSWSGAAAGTNNPITGYEIHRADSEDGDYELFATVSSTATSGSKTLTAPTTNGETHYYKVRTLGTIGGYDGDLSSAYAALACSFASAGAPSQVTLDITNVAPGAKATLKWSGASAGQNNAITGYKVYRANNANGTYTALGSVTTTATSGSMAVTAPSSNGGAYYYKVQTLGTQSGYDSNLSSAYAALACTYSSPSAPSTIQVNGGGSAYVHPGDTVTLTWSGAAAGANNAITGYDIYRDGVALVTGLAASVKSYSISAHSTAGKAYRYTVVARGTYANSAQSVACTVYSYTEPKAPTNIGVSSASVSAGARVKLTWSGAAAGGFNAIKGYRVYRSTQVNGDPVILTSVSTTETTGSVTVNAPGTKGGVYYYRVETMGSYNGSGVSTAYASVTATDDAAGEDSGVTVYVLPQKRAKRGLVIGDYDTAEHGWTLAPGWKFPEPTQQTNFVTVPGRIKGPLDYSTAMTDGDPCYGSRTLTATLELSEGTRMEREATISEMVNRLHGMRLDGVLPDDPSRYITGRWSVVKEYNNPAHAAVKISAICDPWRYSKHETRVEQQFTGGVAEIVLSNNGSCPVAPEVVIEGYGASMTITAGANTWNLTEGAHHLPALVIRHGNTPLACEGFGTLIFKWREAIL